MGAPATSIFHSCTRCYHDSHLQLLKIGESRQKKFCLDKINRGGYQKTYITKANKLSSLTNIVSFYFKRHVAVAKFKLARAQNVILRTAPLSRDFS